MLDVKVGQVVWVTGFRNRPEKTKVEKVGRKYIYLENSRTKYDLEGRECEYIGYPSTIIVDPPSYFKKVHYQDVAQQLNRTDFNRFDIELLEQIRKITGVGEEYDEENYKERYGYED